MKIKINSYLYFNNLIKKINSKSLSNEIRDSLNEKIASSSRRFIRAGKVTPPIKTSTIENRKKGGSKPLLDTGNLANSIRPTKKGITYESYGQYHRSGIGPYRIQSKKTMSFVIDGKRINVKNVSHPGLEKREFISWYVDKNEKKKIIRNVKDELNKSLNKNLRKK